MAPLEEIQRNTLIEAHTNVQRNTLIEAHT